MKKKVKFFFKKILQKMVDEKNTLHISKKESMHVVEIGHENKSCSPAPPPLSKIKWLTPNGHMTAEYFNDH